MRSWILPSAVEICALGTMFIIAGFFVSFEDVFRNATDNLIAGSFLDYSVSAVTETEFAVQAALLAAIVAVFYFLWSGVKKVRTNRKSFLLRA